MPEDVTDLSSHAHWITPTADLFPKARLDPEGGFAYYTGAAWQEGGKHGGIDPEDVAAL